MIRKNVMRIFKIWGERSVYTEEFCDKLQNATGRPILNVISVKNIEAKKIVWIILC